MRTEIATEGPRTAMRNWAAALLEGKHFEELLGGPSLFISVLFGLRSDSLYETFTAVLSLFTPILSQVEHNPLFMVGGGRCFLEAGSQLDRFLDLY